MAYAPLDAQQLAEARQWAGKLGVPEETIIADAQAAKDGAYLEAARAHHGHEAGWNRADGRRRQPDGARRRPGSRAGSDAGRGGGGLMSTPEAEPDDTGWLARDNEPDACPWNTGLDGINLAEPEPEAEAG